MLVAYALLLVSILVTVFLVRKPSHWKDFLKTTSDKITDIPAQLPPAIVGGLMTNMLVLEQQVVGTIFDLAERGYYRLRLAHHERKGILKSREKLSVLIQRTSASRSSTLRPWEASLMDWVDARIAEGRSFNGFTPVDEVFPILGKHALSAKTWFDEWKKEFWTDMEQTGWFRSNKRNAWSAFFIQAAVLLVAWNSDNPETFGLVFLISIAGLAGITLALLNMDVITDRGWQARVVWGAYRKALRGGKVRMTQEAAWRRHLMYAMAMKLGGKTLRRLTESARGLTGPARVEEDWILLEAGDGTTRAEQFSRSLRVCGNAIAMSVGGRRD